MAHAQIAHLNANAARLVTIILYYIILCASFKSKPDIGRIGHGHMAPFVVYDLRS